MKIAAIAFRKFTMPEYMLPALWALRQAYPEAEIHFYYCAGSKEQVFNKDTYLEALMREYGITYSIYFPQIKSKPQARWLNLVDSIQQMFASPSVNLKRMASEMRRKFYYKDYAEIASKHLLNQVQRYAKYVKPYRNETMRFISELEHSHPDFIILDHKWSFYAWPALLDFFNYVANHKAKVLVPPEGCFRGLLYPFSDALPKIMRAKYEYWLPYRDNSVFHEKTDGRQDCHYLSAPNLDSTWIRHLSARHIQPPSRKIRCMYLIRKFLPPNANPAHRELADLTYEQFLETTRIVLEGLQKFGPVELVVKPYPTMAAEEVARAFKELNYGDCTISFDSIFAHVGRIDFAVTELTSGSFPLLVVPTPTLLLEHSIFSELDAVYPEYEPIRKIFPLRTDRHKSLRESFNEQIDIALDKEALAQRMKESQHYLRLYYPDGGCEQFVNRINVLQNERMTV